MAQLPQPWSELSRETAFQKFGRRIDRVIYRMPNGKESDFYIRNEGPAVAVVAITTDNHVVLVRQFRPGPSEVLLELPGGYVGQNETPLQAMQRELLEETGYRGEVHLITDCHDDAYSTMRRYCMVALHCRRVTDPQPEKTEFLETVLVTVNEFRGILRAGRMTDIEVGYLALDHLGIL